MKLQKITVKRLFDLYTYDINLDEEERLIILTGPNGYGKTTILSIINCLYKKNFYYFSTLVFSEIILSFNKGYRITIKKESKESENSDNQTTDVSNVVFELYMNEKKISILNFDKNIFFEKMSNRYRKMGDDMWEDRYSDSCYSTMELFNNNPDLLENGTCNEGSGEILLFLNSLNTCFIKEKRLSETYYITKDLSRKGKKRFNISIQKAADELSDVINQSRLMSLKSAQELESSFPERLLKTTHVLSEKEYKEKLLLLQQKLTLLRGYGLSDMYLSDTEYTHDDNKRILTVYLNDAEKKTLYFDDLLSQIQLFVQIINKKQFASKTLYINEDKGFGFKSIHGKELKLDLLSSGEQHEVIMIYDLLFHAQPNTLVLVDEPEISLHVAWQQAFVKDMMEIAKMRKLDLIIATHSPQIIGGNWDLCVDLYEINNIN